MDLRIFTEPQQGATYDDLLRLARAAEASGFDGFFRSDHYLSMGAGDGLPGPTDAWVTLAGLARDTARLRLGTLVSPVTFRHPGPLAIAVATVDAMSGGRVELGLGTGWFDAEHAAYGLDFPPTRERFDELEDQLAIVHGLWTTPPGERLTYHGHHRTVIDSPALPKPVQRPHPPIVVGGHGRVRTPRLTALFADEFNLAFGRVEDAREQFERVRAACAQAGRDAGGLRLSVAVTVACGRDDAEVAHRARVVSGGLEGSAVVGTPAQVVDRLGEFAALGATRAYLQILDLADLDHVELIAAEVMPQVA